MVEQVQVVSGHPLLTRAVERILARIKSVPVRALPPAANETYALSRGSAPALFVLDACSLRTDLGPIAARCRGNLPGSKFLALLPPDTPISEQTRLFYWGIDGFLELGRTWQAELPKAIERIVRGQLWVPREVLLAQLLGTLQSPVAQLVATIQAPVQQLIGLLEAYKDKLEGGPQAA